MSRFIINGVTSECSVEVNGGQVGNVVAGSHVTCGRVDGNVQVGSHVTWGDVHGHVMAGSYVDRR